MTTRTGLCVFLALVCGCSDDTETMATGIVTTLNGFVAGANIATEGASTTADGRGRFKLALGDSTSSVLTFTHPGHAPAYLEVRPNGATTVTVRAVLAKITSATSIDVRQGPATVQDKDLVLTFPQGSIKTRSGKTPDGPVEVAVTWLDRILAPVMGPVPLMGTDGKETHPLTTLGMFDVSLSFAGEACDLADGKTMGISLPAGPGDPPTAGLFYVDPKRALWVQEGSATNAGGQWTAQVPHLSWWNVDLFYKVPANMCACVQFVAKTPAGKGLGGVSISSSPTAKYTFGGWTDLDGTLCHPCFPTGELIKVSWAAFLGVDALDGVSGSLDLTPTATGATCGSAACQVVTIPIQCTTDAHCDPGQACKGGSCGTGGAPPPPPNKLFGSCHVLSIGLCHEFIGSGADQATAQKVCDSQGAKGELKIGQPCPAANALGRCTFKGGTPSETATIYYRPIFDGAVDSLRSACTQGGGAWN
jgi:hypothetical protein